VRSEPPSFDFFQNGMTDDVLLWVTFIVIFGVCAICLAAALYEGCRFWITQYRIEQARQQAEEDVLHHPILVRERQQQRDGEPSPPEASAISVSPPTSEGVPA